MPDAPFASGVAVWSVAVAASDGGAIASARASTPRGKYLSVTGDLNRLE